jgi:hydroxymethylpyrimidine/phosphomethylpyrimidine kinase
MTTPIALTIAGSDSGGGAGIQADLKTFAALGVYGASVITALTAQNTRGVHGVHLVSPDFVTAQLDAVFDDLTIGAVKIVMVATSGDRLLAEDAVDGLRQLLIPRSALITPNLPEAAALLGEPIATSEAAISDQGRRLLALGCPAVLIKGGHGEGAESTDYLITANGALPLAAPRLATRNTHGTGCSLSSAVAAGLAKGEDLESAVRHAKAFISDAIAAADRLDIGHGHGPVHHFHRFY